MTCTGYFEYGSCAQNGDECLHTNGVDYAYQVTFSTILPFYRWGGNTTNFYSTGSDNVCYAPGPETNCILGSFIWQSTPPGWSSGAVNSKPLPAFQIPVKSSGFSGTSGCASWIGKNGSVNYYNNYNSRGVLARCNITFQEFRGNNLPEPATCKSSIVICNDY